MVDHLITPGLVSLRDTAVAHLAAIGRPVARFPVHFNGGHPPADACDCVDENGNATGQGWARMVSINGQTGADRWNNCLIARYDVTLEIGLYRCSPVPDGEFLVPEDTETEHALGMHDDAAALRRVVRCCPWIVDNDLTSVLTHQSAIGPSGGCVGIETQIRITLEDG